MHLCNGCHEYQIRPEDIRVCDECGNPPTIAVRHDGGCVTCHLPMRTATGGERLTYAKYLDTQENPARRDLGLPLFSITYT